MSNIAALRAQVDAICLKPALPEYLTISVVDRLAMTMRRLAFGGHTVNADALAAEGFSRTDIERHWRQAAELARQQSIKRIRVRVPAGRG